ERFVDVLLAVGLLVAGILFASSAQVSDCTTTNTAFESYHGSTLFRCGSMNMGYIFAFIAVALYLATFALSFAFRSSSSERDADSNHSGETAQAGSDAVEATEVPVVKEEAVDADASAVKEEPHAITPNSASICVAGATLTLVVSDEFVEAFKLENPQLANKLLAKKLGIINPKQRKASALPKHDRKSLKARWQGQFELRNLQVSMYSRIYGLPSVVLLEKSIQPSSRRSSMLVEPTTILPLDAPPLVPYDDGFSTESESWDEPPEETAAEAKAEPVVHPPPTVAIASEEASDADAEEGEVLEQRCARCTGALLSPIERQRLAEIAALANMSKKPLRSRACACCRITYPLTAFNKKNRKPSRAVARCMQCSEAGGSAVYEMLAVSDEFIEAFTRENPDLASRLLAQKQLLTERVRALQAQNEEQTRRVMAYEATQTAIRANNAVEKAAQHAGREEARPFSEREGEPKRHLTVKEWYERHDAALRSEREHRLSSKEPPMPQGVRRLDQFELVDGNTTRERRLESRESTSEHQVDAKRQRTDT
ncbi:hypothetical protein BBJ28_00011200, partial [Nothophytophthora sp. Chile5]